MATSSLQTWSGFGGDRVSFDEPPQNAQTSLATIVATIVVGCIARVFLDGSRTDLPSIAALVLLGFLAVQFALKSRTALIGILAIPGFFGLAPWNSPVRAYFGSVSFPIYFFDLLVLIGGTVAVLNAIETTRTSTANFIQKNWPIFVVVASVLLLKIGQVGVSAESVRSSAIFYYFLSTPLIITYVNDQADLKWAVPWFFLKAIPIVAIVPAVCLIGIALGGRDLVLDSLGRQGLVVPAGLFEWAPPGSLVLLSFLGAAFLFERRAPISSRAAIAILLAYDYFTYWDRALWLAIAFGLAAGWVVKKGWKAFLLVVIALMLAFALQSNLRKTAGEAHNNSSEWRLLAWGLTLGAIEDKPFLGHPYDKSVFAQILPSSDSRFAMSESNIRLNEQARSPHNSYLSLLFFGGLAQGGAIILFIVSTLVGFGRQIAWRAHSKSPSWMAEAVFRGVCACALYAGFNVVMETPMEALTFWMLLISGWLWHEALRNERKILARLLTSHPPSRSAVFGST